jgi:hypothetical protein
MFNTLNNANKKLYYAQIIKEKVWNYQKMLELLFGMLN